MMSRNSGSDLNEIPHIEQSVEDITSTPLGSRIMRRDYGTLLANLLDSPINDALILQCYSTIYSAISRWEKRIQVSRIGISSITSGAIVIDLECVLSKTGQALNLNIPVKLGAGL